MPQLNWSATAARLRRRRRHGTLNNKNKTSRIARNYYGAEAAYDNYMNPESGFQSNALGSYRRQDDFTRLLSYY